MFLDSRQVNLNYWFSLMIFLQFSGSMKYHEVVKNMRMSCPMYLLYCFCKTLENDEKVSRVKITHNPTTGNDHETSIFLYTQTHTPPTKFFNYKTEITVS